MTTMLDSAILEVQDHCSVGFKSLMNLSEKCQSSALLITDSWDQDGAQGL